MTDWAFLSATDLAARIRRGAITSVALTDYFIDRIERLDGDVNIPVLFIVGKGGRRRLDQPNVGYRFKYSRC